MTSGVYWIYQTSRDRAVYVGSTNSIETRLSAHRGALKSGKHHNVRLIHTWNKYGADDFQFLLLEECSIGRLIEREQFWIDAISPVCNMAAVADNPNRGRHLSEEHRARISAANKGMTSWAKGTKLSEAHKRKVSESNRGKKRSAESRKKISLALIGKNPWNKGKKFSDEYRKKLSDAKRGRPALNKGKKYDDVVCKRMSESRLGLKHTEDHKRHISESNKKRWADSEYRMRRKATYKPKEVSDETRRKMSEAAKRREAKKREID